MKLEIEFDKSEDKEYPHVIILRGKNIVTERKCTDYLPFWRIKEIYQNHLFRDAENDE